MGRLDVRIVEARNLPDLEAFGKSDPYVKVTCENATMKTDVADNTLNPKWDHVMKFVIADPNSSQLEMSLWNSNTLSSDDFMGQYKLSLGGLVKGQVKDQWCLLQNCKTNAEIRVRLLAVDFGADPAPGQQPGMMMPQQQPGVYQQQHPHGGPPGHFQQQPPQQPMYQQQQPMYQQQQPQMGFQQQPQPMGFQQPPPQQQQPMGMMGQMGMAMGSMMAGAMNMMGNNLNGPPSQTFADFQVVQFRGPVRKANYAPIGQQNDVTMLVNALIQRGQLQVHGGIHTAIGDPFPGVAKQFSVWY